MISEDKMKKNNSIQIAKGDCMKDGNNLFS